MEWYWIRGGETKFGEVSQYSFISGIRYHFMNKQVDLITNIGFYSNDLKMIFIYAVMVKVNKNEFLEQFPTKRRVIKALLTVILTVRFPRTVTIKIIHMYVFRTPVRLIESKPCVLHNNTINYTTKYTEYYCVRL